MIVTYKPEDGEPQSWAFDPGRVRSSRAEMIEKRAGMTWDNFLAEVQKGNTRARRVLLWHLMSMPHPTMRYEDTPDFYAEELEVSHTSAELTEMRDKALKAGLSEDELRPALMVLDMELAAAREREGLAADAEPEGKASSKAAGAATPSPSRKSSASGRGSSTA